MPISRDRTARCKRCSAMRASQRAASAAPAMPPIIIASATGARARSGPCPARSTRVVAAARTVNKLTAMFSEIALSRR
jgi:hypothetical protein